MQRGEGRGNGPGSVFWVACKRSKPSEGRGSGETDSGPFSLHLIGSGLAPSDLV